MTLLVSWMYACSDMHVLRCGDTFLTCIMGVLLRTHIYLTRPYCHVPQGKTQLKVNRLREAEIIHGRVGMLAAAGFLVQEQFHPLFSGDGGPAIDQIPQLPVWLWVIMGAGITGAEALRINKGFRELDGEKLKAETALRPGYVPGDLEFDPLSLAPEDPEEFRVMQEKELAHARIAMIAAAGFLAQEAVTKTTWGSYFGL